MKKLARALHWYILQTSLVVPYPIVGTGASVSTAPDSAIARPRPRPRPRP